MAPSTPTFTIWGHPPLIRGIIVPPKGWIYLKAPQSDLLQPLPGGSLAAKPCDQEATERHQLTHPPASISASACSSGCPPHQRSSAWRNGLSGSSAASENSVMHDRNLMSSGEPNIAWRDGLALASTIPVQRSSLGPSPGWARYARASSMELMP